MPLDSATPHPTYNDDQVQNYARVVYMKALKKLETALDADTFSPERVEALGTAAMAASNGIALKDDEEDFGG